jgi:16S rRNA (cytosine967-C5)-methyltransferase
MTPSARCQAAIELLDAIENSTAPADQILNGYFRARRFAGSGDRRAIQALVYAVLRRRGQIDWWCNRFDIDISNRSRALGALALTSVWDREACERAFAPGPHGSGPLSDGESACFAQWRNEEIDHPEQPASVRGNVPDWLDALWSPEINNNYEIELKLLNAEGTIDLRANTLKSNRAQVLERLREEGVEGKPTPLAPDGIRLAHRQPLKGLASFREGLYEPQDEASQLAAALAGARPGHAVLDYCAGAGGKALALGAAMQNEGRLVLHDLGGRRQDEAARRLGRAGVAIFEMHAAQPGSKGGLQAESFDIVLVDAPCSGSGVWRRNPDGKWRLTPERLAELVAVQAVLLREASEYVRPGGRLLYMTCSLLDEENRRQVERFLDAPEGAAFERVSPAADWARVTGRADAFPREDVLLSPARNGTDGFYIAVLQRKLP